jgi:hypothetical protein
MSFVLSSAGRLTVDTLRFLFALVNHAAINTGNGSSIRAKDGCDVMILSLGDGTPE